MSESTNDDRPVICRDVRKAYRRGTAETPALRGVDLDVDRGEWVAIMGPSGSGKSTLLQLLGGLDSADAGSIVVCGHDLSALSESRRARLRRRRVGYVFQFFNLLPELTVVENVALPVLLAGSSRRQARLRATGLLDALDVGDAGDRSPSQLSGGQQQRVALARALANRPGVLLADEPTGNLDSETARQVLGLLRGEHRGGQTIVMVTHDPHVAAAASRVVVLQDGRIAREQRDAPLLATAAGR